MSKEKGCSREKLDEAEMPPLAVGHSPVSMLSPQDAQLFQAFQRNLLSLISHELRTPLMGVLNALSLLDEGPAEVEIDSRELVSMARRNAQRLHRALITLLDLASIESGTYRARLRETELSRVVRGRVEVYQRRFHDHSVLLRWADARESVVLADPGKLSRALDLALELALVRAQSSSEVQVRISSSAESAVVAIELSLQPGARGQWAAHWTEWLAAFEGGVGSPSSAFWGAFGGVLQSEQAFLSREEEGLGSEFLLLHEIMRLHQGRFDAKLEGSNLTISLAIPRLSSEEGLRAVLMSRALGVSTELGSVGLVLVEVPGGTQTEDFCAKVKSGLFRSSDAAYPIPSKDQVALVLDDCKPEDAPRMMKRLENSFSAPLRYGIAHCPTDCLDPGELIALANSRLTKSRSSSS